VNQVSTLQLRIAALPRAFSGAVLHAIAWGLSLYYLSMKWERPYLVWAQSKGFDLPPLLNEILKFWAWVERYPYPTAVLFGLLVVVDIYIMIQFSPTPLMRVLRDLWFISLLALPLLFCCGIGIVQIESFLEREIDPYAMSANTPEVATELDLFDGKWIGKATEVAGEQEAVAVNVPERIEFKDGTFHWNSNEMGTAIGTIYFESQRERKHVKFVAMHPDSRWTIRSGIYRFEKDKLYLMMPKWDSLSLAPPLDFQWDDLRYETLVFEKERQR